jgi:thiol-disulfide isomerase/thioredoxin
LNDPDGRSGSRAGAAAIAVALGLASSFLLAADPPAGKAGPQVEVVDASGLKRALDEARGKVVILNFWATWCDPCREEFPDLVRYATENASSVALITVSLDDPGDVDGKVRPFLGGMRAPGRAFVKGPGDPDPFITGVDPTWSGALPATFIHAADGRRVHAIHGATSYEDLTAKVGPLLPKGR